MSRKLTLLMVGISSVILFGFIGMAGATASDLPSTAEKIDEDSESNQLNEIDFEIRPVDDGNTAKGTTEKFELVIKEPNDGIVAYSDIIVEIGDTSNAKFVDFYETANDNPGGTPPITLSEIRDSSGAGASEGPILYLESALADKTFDDGAPEIVIAEFTVVPTADFGTTGITIYFSNPQGMQIQGTSGDYYSNGNMQSAFMDVEVIDITGNNKSAADTTGDRLLNDVDGDGTFDIFDVQAFFNAYKTDAVTNNVDYFDFNGDEKINIFDVQALFGMV